MLRASLLGWGSYRNPQANTSEPWGWGWEHWYLLKPPGESSVQPGREPLQNNVIKLASHPALKWDFTNDWRKAHFMEILDKWRAIQFFKKKIVQRECRAGTAVPRGKVLGLCAGTLSKAASHYDMVFPVCESWTLKKAEHWRTDAFELWCWRRLLRVP